MHTNDRQKACTIYVSSYIIFILMYQNFSVMEESGMREGARLTELLICPSSE